MVGKLGGTESTRYSGFPRRSKFNVPKSSKVHLLLQDLALLTARYQELGRTRHPFWGSVERVEQSAERTEQRSSVEKCTSYRNAKTGACLFWPQKGFLFPPPLTSCPSVSIAEVKSAAPTNKEPQIHQWHAMEHIELISYSCSKGLSIFLQFVHSCSKH